MTQTSDMALQIIRIREHTKDYTSNDEFMAQWTGLSATDIALRTQQQKAFVKLVSQFASDLKGLRILDVGCGDGRWLRWYAELGAQVKDIVGVDVSDLRFSVGRAINPLVSMIQIDEVTLPFRDRTFDLVTQWVCFMCIPSFEMRKMVANEMVRVLRPGGYIFWWDLPQTYTPSAPSEKLHPADYFGSLYITEVEVSAVPLPSEGVRPLKGLGPVVGRILDFLGHRPSHIAALIGPKL